MPDPKALGVTVVADAEGVSAVVDTVSGIRCEEAIINYIVAIVRGTRSDAGLSYGASPRSAAMLASASRARAALDGRDYVVPDDVKALALPALRHRVVLSPAAEIDGRRADDIIAAIVERVAAPR
jgi:MoxR-like ATPase